MKRRGREDRAGSTAQLSLPLSGPGNSVSPDPLEILLQMNRDILAARRANGGLKC